MGVTLYITGSYAVLCSCGMMMLYEGYPSRNADGQMEQIGNCGNCQQRYRIVLPSVWAEELKGSDHAVIEKSGSAGTAGRAADGWAGAAGPSAHAGSDATDQGTAGRRAEDAGIAGIAPRAEPR